MVRPASWLLFATGLALLVLLVLPGPPLLAEPDEWAKELDGRDFRVAGENTLLSARAIDYWTGRPVEGAEIRLFHEVLHPVPGFGDPIAQATTGADGWAWVALESANDDRSGDWAYFVAPGGLGPDSRFRDFLGETVELREAHDVPLEFRDPLDRPVADLGVGLLLGCGHTPNVWLGRTDGDGRVVIPSVQTQGFKQVWIRKAGLLSHYPEWDAWEPGDPPLRHRCRWSMVIEGRLLKHDGTPAAGVAVGTRNFHRGPWGYSDENGDFAVLGTGFEPGDTVYVEPFEGRVGVTEWHTTLDFAAPPPGVKRIFRLPPPDEDPEPPALDAKLRVDATIDTAPPAVASLVGHRVVVARLSDGWTEECLLDEDGAPVLAVPAGRYQVVAWMTGCYAPFPGLAEVRREIDVAAGTEALAEVRLPAPRLLRVSTRGWPEDGDLRIVTETVEYDADPGAERETMDVVAVPIPTAGDVYLRVEQGAVERLVPLPPLAFAPDAEPFLPPWLQPVTVRARIVDPSGAPLAAWFSVDRRNPDAYGVLDFGEPESAHEVTVLPSAGLEAWVWTPEHAWATKRVPLPSHLPEGEVLDLGAVSLVRPPEPRLWIRGADGEPLEGVEVRISTPEAHVEAETNAQGGIVERRGPESALAEGAVVQVLADPLPWRATLSGPPPWRLDPPPGRLVVRALDEAGAPLADVTVFVDGTPVEMRSSEVEVPGLRVGPHDVIVARADRYAWHYRVVLDGKTPREIESRLRTLPEEAE